MDTIGIKSKNYFYHVVEGMLYISTSAMLSAQTIMPALIKKLGGSDVLIGAWPVVVYLAYFMPQIISANYSSVLHYRKPFVIRRGFLQRMHIFLLALSIAIYGDTIPTLALILMFLIYISNQVTAGSVSPIWMDFFVKTTSAKNRGKIMGWRTSLSAVLGLLNGIILTFMLTTLRFPYNYAAVIGLAFIYQMSSLSVQQRIIEESPSDVVPPIKLIDLYKHINTIVDHNVIFKKFLIASALLTASFSAVAFFTVAAIKKFGLMESTIGIFTVVTMIGQIISGAIIGWIADSKGTKTALVICGLSLFLSILLAIFAYNIIWFYFVFAFLGVNIGAEMVMRYNFAVECSSKRERAMYIGIMNAWLAPFYIITPLVGWLSINTGYNFVFILSLIIAAAGIVLLIQIPDNRIKKLALSSK